MLVEVPSVVSRTSVTDESVVFPVETPGFIVTVLVVLLLKLSPIVVPS